MPPHTPAADEDPLLRKQRLDRGMRTAWLILLLALVATLFAWAYIHREAERTAEARFRARAHDAVVAIRSRMDAYAQLLKGGVGVFRVSSRVDAKAWREYVATQEIERHYPGTLGLGYAPFVPAARLDELRSDAHRQQRPPLRLRPPGHRAAYVPIFYLEPFDRRNRRAYGYDMYSEPRRRLAMDKARDTGEIAISSPVTLTQETVDDVQGGLLMYAPVYRGHPKSVDERRRQLQGFVFAPLRINDLMEGILAAAARKVHIVVYDGKSMTPGNTMYDNLPGKPHPDEEEFNETIAVGNHIWTVHVCCKVPNAGGLDLSNERAVLAAGLLISLLLFILSWSLATTRARALGIARRITGQLRDERARLAEITATVGEGVLVQEMDGTITYCNPAAAHMLGWEPQQIIGRNANDFRVDEVPTSGLATDYPAQPAETRYRRRDGTTFPVSMISTAIMRDGENVGAVTSFHDMTESHRSEAALQEVRQFENLFQYSSEALFLLDLEGRIIDVNRVALESLGYERDQLIGRRSDAYVRWATVPQPGQTLHAFFAGLGSGARVRGEAEHLRKDGSSFIVETAFSPITYNDRRMVLVSARDITERKEAELRIQHALDELERARRDEEEANRRLAESNRELQRISRCDGLTGIANRRHFDEYLEMEWNRAAREHRPLSLLMVDVDHFKAYNDSYGHQAGDECLRQVAATLDRQLGRSIDMVARYGGEEFVVVLPETPLSGAVNIGDRLRLAVEGLHIPHDRSPVAAYLTISVGAASIVPQHPETKDGLLSAADAALYRAKQDGRNRVCTAGPAEE